MLDVAAGNTIRSILVTIVDGSIAAGTVENNAHLCIATMHHDYYNEFMMTGLRTSLRIMTQRYETRTGYKFVEINLRLRSLIVGS